MSRRRYTLKRRAEKQAQTRARIVEAAVRLHESEGPKATSIAAIARRAGVQRLTVYRHFPDEESLFRACTGHWMAANPPPDPAAWRDLADGEARCCAALTALYAYYRRTAPMLAGGLRDEGEVPALRAAMDAYRAYLAELHAELLLNLAPPLPARPAVDATLGHALSLAAWQSLNDQGLDDPAMAALVMAWLRGAAGGPGMPAMRPRRSSLPADSGRPLGS